MSNFFRTVVISAADAARHPDAVRRLRQEAFEGIILRDIYDPTTCARLCTRLEEARHGLMESALAGSSQAYCLGIDAALTPQGPSAYRRAVPVHRNGLAELSAIGIDLETRLKALLSALDDGRRYVSVPGPRGGIEHMFTTLRAHQQDEPAPCHFATGQASRQSARLVMPNIVSDVYCFVLAFSQVEAGGELEIFSPHQGSQHDDAVDETPGEPRLSVAGMESVKLRLAPGEMMIFNSDRYQHGIAPVIGTTTGWTACSFMAESRTGEMLCWG
ncbi:hypothetical protein [Rhodopila sp.]|uniref:2OG-Fe(II)-dependent halogenase WelO5 family protein n=1 Tax=Rhodopila sp. TaxID=2480087 RepID=UPI003D12FF37